MSLSFEGLKVLDVSQVAAVPMAARHLADFGADVIHVERPKAGDMFREVGERHCRVVGKNVNYLWENFNRNKKSITIDLNQPSGRKVIYRLVEKLDVFLTNLRPYELERFNLQYETLSRINPRLIYGHLTGYGDAGQDKDVPSFDYTAYWSRSGAANYVPAPGTRPDFPPGAFGDSVAALGLAFGIATALFARTRTGLGQEVDLSLFQTGVYQLSQEIAPALGSVEKYEDYWMRRRVDPPNPLASMYQTKDGRWIAFMALQPDLYWSKFCKAMDLTELEHDKRFDSTQSRNENRHVLRSILEKALRTRTLEEWKPLLKGIPFDPVQSLPEILSDPQALANDFFVSFEHPVHGPIQIIANPVKLSKTPATYRTPAPEFGQHTEETLLENGYSWEEIGLLKERGVV